MSSTSGSPNSTNRLPLPVFLRILGHVKVGIHPGLEDGQRREPGDVGNLGVEIERAGDERIETSLGGLTGGGCDR